MELKTEKSICEFLETLPDDTIIKYYLDVEYSPFPVLIIKEYQRRFKKKSRKEILKKLSYQASLAKKKSKELGRMARQNKLVNDISKQKSEEILRQAKKKGLKISSNFSKKAKKSLKTRFGSSTEANLRVLEKLSRLKKSGAITEKEFQAAKRKILKKI